MKRLPWSVTCLSATRRQAELLATQNPDGSLVFSAVSRDYCPSSSFHLPPSALHTDNVTRSKTYSQNLYSSNEFSGSTLGGTLAKQPADLHSLETALCWAREMAEERGEHVVLYCIDMAIAEVKMKSPPTANDHKPRGRKQSRVSRKKIDMQSEIWSAFLA